VRGCMTADRGAAGRDGGLCWHRVGGSRFDWRRQALRVDRSRGRDGLRERLRIATSAPQERDRERVTITGTTAAITRRPTKRFDCGHYGQGADHRGMTASARVYEARPWKPWRDAALLGTRRRRSRLVATGSPTCGLGLGGRDGCGEPLRIATSGTPERRDGIG